MYRVEFLVKHVEDGELVALYASDDFDLPFVPTVGMQFAKGSSTWLWETDNGELMPSVESVTYDFDEETLVCIFTVDSALNASFWTRIDASRLDSSTYGRYLAPRA